MFSLIKTTKHQFLFSGPNFDYLTSRFFALFGCFWMFLEEIGVPRNSRPAFNDGFPTAPVALSLDCNICQHITNKKAEDAIS